MIIVNNTKLSNCEIGGMIDRIEKRGNGSTIFVGKIDTYTCRYDGKYYKVEIEYMKKHVRYVFNEVNR